MFDHLILIEVTKPLVVWVCDSSNRKPQLYMAHQGLQQEFCLRIRKIFRAPCRKCALKKFDLSKVFDNVENNIIMLPLPSPRVIRATNTLQLGYPSKC